MGFSADCFNCFWGYSSFDFSDAPDVREIYGVLGDPQTEEVITYSK